MEERELAEVVEQQQPYYEAVPAPSPEEDEGTAAGVLENQSYSYVYKAFKER